MRHLALLVLLAAGCRTNIDEVESSVDTDAPTRQITLQRGDRIAITVDESGAAAVTVTIVGPGRNAGHYTTTEEALLPAARDAFAALDRPGATVWIRVNEHDVITAIGNKQVR